MFSKRMQNYKEINGVNSLAAIEDRLRKGTLPQVGVIAMAPARAVYSYLVQFLVIALFFIAGNAHPYESSLGWWTVWGTVVNIACLITLTLLVQREGIRLFDLVGVMRSQLKRDLLHRWELSDLSGDPRVRHGVHSDDALHLEAPPPAADYHPLDRRPQSRYHSPALRPLGRQLSRDLDSVEAITSIPS